jgi:hypothetical protein
MLANLARTERLEAVRTLPKHLRARRDHLTGAQPSGTLLQENLVRHSRYVELRYPAGHCAREDSPNEEFKAFIVTSL